MFDLNTLLVPVDFSPTSHVIVRRAIELVTGDKPMIILLHVIDPTLADFAEAHGFGTQDEVSRDMRQLAETRINEYRQEVQEKNETVEIQQIVCEGIPFLEIIRKADEFQVHAILMGKFGTRGLGAQGHAASLLFGSTAERVIRGATRPVIVFPAEPDN